MAEKRRAKVPRTKHNAGALNGLPVSIAVTLKRTYLTARWHCELTQPKHGGGVTKWGGLGNTSDEAADQALISYHNAVDSKVIQSALDKTHGDKKAAAALLGISRKTLYRRLETQAQV